MCRRQIVQWIFNYKEIKKKILFGLYNSYHHLPHTKHIPDDDVHGSSPELPQSQHWDATWRTQNLMQFEEDQLHYSKVTTRCQHQNKSALFGSMCPELSGFWGVIHRISKKKINKKSNNKLINMFKSKAFRTTVEG